MVGVVGMTRMERALRALRRDFEVVWRVEYWHAQARRRMDLLGIIDVIALAPGRIVGVQVCGEDFAAHWRKITEERRSNTAAWLIAGGELEIHAWRKVKVKRGGKMAVWRPRIVSVGIGDVCVILT